MSLLNSQPQDGKGTPKMPDDLKQIIHRHWGERSDLISILQKIQEQYGYLPPEAMQETASYLKIPDSAVFAVATFYSQFRFEPRGEKLIRVCLGTACHVRGADRFLDNLKNNLGIEEGETTPDGKYTLESVACIGCCALSPVLTLNEEVIANITSPKIRKMLMKK